MTKFFYIFRGQSFEEVYITSAGLFEIWYKKLVGLGYTQITWKTLN